MKPADYNYETSGFDGFLSRGPEPMMNLHSQGPSTTQIRYDSTQVSGMLGDTLQIGGVRIEKDAIIMNDDNNDFLIIGEDGTGS